MYFMLCGKVDDYMTAMKFDIDRLLKMLEEPFTYKDTAYHKFLKFICELILIIRYFYICQPLILKLLIGLPVLYFGISVYVWYAVFVVWTKVIDEYFLYDLSAETFSMRKYFKINFLRQLLFIFTFIFMYVYYKVPLGWICFIYTVFMLMLASGYIAPEFDRRIYAREK